MQFKASISPGLFRLSADVSNPDRKSQLAGFTMNHWKTGTLVQVAIHTERPEVVNAETGEVTSPAVQVFVMRIHQQRGGCDWQPVADMDGTVRDAAPAAMMTLLQRGKPVERLDSDELLWITGCTPSEALQGLLDASAAVDANKLVETVLKMAVDTEAKRAAAASAAAEKARLAALAPAPATGDVPAAAASAVADETPTEYKARTGNDLETAFSVPETAAPVVAIDVPSSEMPSIEHEVCSVAGEPMAVVVEPLGSGRKNKNKKT